MLMVVMVLMGMPMSVVMISHNVPFLVSLPRSYIAFPATWLQSGGETINGESFGENRFTRDATLPAPHLSNLSSVMAKDCHDREANTVTSTSKVVLEFYLADTAVPPSWYCSIS